MPPRSTESVQRERVCADLGTWADLVCKPGAVSRRAMDGPNEHLACEQSYGLSEIREREPG